MNQIDAMRIFVRVAELSSFTAAAEQLDLPKATVSGAVQQLERQLDARLLNRTTRRVKLTLDGQAAMERCLDLLSDLDDLRTMFQRTPAALTGRLRVDMPTGLAKNLMPRIPEFLERHPGITLELNTTDRRVDLIREGFDCVVRVGALQDLTLVARLLGHLRMVNCVSPAYVARFGVPDSIAALTEHRLVHYVTTPSTFEYVDAAGQVQEVPMQGVLTVNESEAYRAACRAGLGIIQLPEHGAREELASGTLVEILPAHRAAPMPVNLLYASRRHLSRRLRAFIDWIAESSSLFVSTVAS